MMRLCSSMVFLRSACTALSISSSGTSLRAALNSARTSATAVFSTMFGFATDAAEPSIRNSNLFPVNANGEVRFLSVVSFMKCGSTFAPISICTACLLLKKVSFSIDFSTSVSSSPRKMDTIAGGASFAPRR